MPIIIEFTDLGRWEETVAAKVPKADRLYTATEAGIVTQVVALDPAATYRCLLDEAAAVTRDDPRLAGSAQVDDINVI